MYLGKEKGGDSVATCDHYFVLQIMEFAIVVREASTIKWFGFTIGVTYYRVRIGLLVGHEMLLLFAIARDG